MRNLIRILLTAAAAVVMTMLPGCGDDHARYRIGVSQCSADEWRSQMNDEIRREMLFHEDAEVEIRSANDNNARQIADIEYFIDNKFDAIIVAPNEREAITPVIKRAYEKGIPVIIFDRNINEACYTSYLELDNEGIGRSAAEWAINALQGREGRILEVRGLDESTPAKERHAGFASVIAERPDIVITSSVEGEWNGAKARELVDSVLQAHPEINLIYAHNDVMAIAASEAARALGMDHIKILGTDAAPALGIKAVADSVIDATFVYPTEGQRVIKTAMSILKGEPFEKEDRVPAQFAVDSTNAHILLSQNELLKNRTQQIQALQDKNDMITSAHRVQSYFLYAVAAAALLLIAGVGLLLWYVRQRHRYTDLLTQKNSELEAERDKQKELYRQLDEATQSKLMFFTNVSHDLRTPLTLVAEPVGQIAEADYLTPAHRRLIGIAQKNIGILRRMIEQILDFRRYQNGKTELHLSEANIGMLITEWSESFRTVAAKRHMRYEVETQDAPKSMAVDVEKLERVLFNLVSNAFKFTPDHGTIEVCAEQVGDIFQLSVRDSGIGISEQDQKRIFDRFYQVDSINPNGSGIGLALTKGLVEVMEGTIEVKSTPGNGTLMTVRLPMRHIEEISQDSEISDSNRRIVAELMESDELGREMEGDKPLVLVIDDNADVRAVIEDLIGPEYDIMKASDGRAGLKMARKYVPDLVICDIMMPVMDGLECCRLIKEEISTSHIPVLILTACKLDEQRVQSYDSGADSYLSKPFNAEVLRSRCRNLLTNRERIKNLYQRSDSLEPAGASPRRERPTAGDPIAAESEFYNRFLSIVMAEYSDSELSLADIAYRLGLGQTQLARKIRALTGLSPVDIIRNVRLRAARQQIISTDKNISEIAYEVGFSSPPYFSKCFRDAYGISPTELRTDPK